MNRYYVPEELKNSLKHILIRSYHEFRFQKDENESTVCVTPINAKNFERLLLRAECEKMSKADGVFYVTAEERDNMVLKSLLLDSANKKSCCVLPRMEDIPSIH